MSDRKASIGLIIGLIAAGVLALGSAVAGLVVLTGSDDDRITNETVSSESPAPSAEPAAGASDNRLAGNGYSYALPEEWNDVSAAELAEEAPGAIDTVSTWGADVESGRANLIVERQPIEVSDPEDLREGWEANLGNAVGVTPTSGPDIEIAGERAISATLRSVNQQKISVDQTAYLAVVDDAAYSITLSAVRGDKGAASVFGEILGSWAWE